MASWIQLLVSAAILGITAAASPSCTNPEVRKSWHDIPNTQKAAYLAAQKCIISSPPKQGRIPWAKTRWDEIVGLHQLLALQIHSTGNFLPYHRYFLHIHKFLLAECGYNDSLPYWDETRDAGSFSKSPLFDATYGFGGSGTGAQSCVPNGPFAGLNVNIGPGFSDSPRCINRKVTDVPSTQCGASYVMAAIAPNNYNDAARAIYLGPHLMGHEALFMMNGDSITSAGDPLFMTHHGFVDKMWADWQKGNASRLLEIGGLNAQDPAKGFWEFGGTQASQASMWGTPSAAQLAITPDPQFGDGGPNMTLNHSLSSLGIIPNATVADIMNTQGGYLCYVYE